MDRRTLFTMLTSVPLMPMLAASAPGGDRLRAFDEAIAALEKKAGGRLGVALFSGGDAPIAGNRFDERFPFCSTFKLPLAAAMLEADDRSAIALDERIRYSAADLMPSSPVTRQRVASGGMTVGELAQATQTTSDNAAANLLLARLGGPAALTAAFRRWGDAVSRVDRYEPEMNRFLPGDARDTTTPRAMAMLLSRLMFGGILSRPSRDRLASWMIDTRTGLKRLRAGLPEQWLAGDKTGTGYSPTMTDKLNDVAVVWPHGARPFALACYYDSPRHSGTIRDEDQAVLAEVGRLAAGAIAGG